MPTPSHLARRRPIACCLLFLAPSLSALAQGAPPAAVATGSYECWGNGSPRMLLNLQVTGSGSYRSPEGQKGAFSYDTRTGAVAFKGGHLDGVMPAGFVTIYHEPKGRPTFSFRSGRGAEASFCERVGK